MPPASIPACAPARATSQKMELSFLVAAADCARRDDARSDLSLLSVASAPPATRPDSAMRLLCDAAGASGMDSLAAAAAAAAAGSPASSVSTALSGCEGSVATLSTGAHTPPPPPPQPPVLAAAVPTALPTGLATGLGAAEFGRPAASGGHTCGTCGAVFGQKLRLLHHAWAEHGAVSHGGKTILPCGLCDAAFLRRTDRTKHTLCVHERRRPHRCEVVGCGSSFFFAKDLTKHHSTVHERNKPFACTVCSKKFGKREHMTSHIRRVHQKLKPYKCDLCGIRLASKYNLQGHLRTAAHAAVKQAAERALRAAGPAQPVQALGIAPAGVVAARRTG